jgi:hypothetical protein
LVNTRVEKSALGYCCCCLDQVAREREKQMKTKKKEITKTNYISCVARDWRVIGCSFLLFFVFILFVG